MSKPKIALIADVILRDADALSMYQADYATGAVCESIIQAGGIPAILPVSPRENLEESIKTYLEMYDGFYFVGGADIDPQFFGEEPIWECGNFDTDKDYFEIHLARAAYDANKAIFANCRGIQLINVALGGTVHQDLKSQTPEYYIKHENLNATSPAHKPTHHVEIEKDSILFPIIGEKVFVNSRHHQGIKEVAQPLKVIGRSPDGLVEALQTRDDDRIVAVQWHPENLWPDNPAMLGIYKNFIERANARRK